MLDRQIVSTPYFTNIEIFSLIKYCSQITFREANSITNMTHVSNTYDGTLIYQDATGTIKRVDGYGLAESGGV